MLLNKTQMENQYGNYCSKQRYSLKFGADSTSVSLYAVVIYAVGLEELLYITSFLQELFSVCFLNMLQYKRFNHAFMPIPLLVTLLEVYIIPSN